MPQSEVKERPRNGSFTYIHVRAHLEGGSDRVELLEHLPRGVGGTGASRAVVALLLVVSPEMRCEDQQQTL